MTSKRPVLVGAVLLCLSTAEAQPAASTSSEPSECPPGPRIIHVMPGSPAPAPGATQPSPADAPPPQADPRQSERAPAAEGEDLARFMGLRLRDMTPDIAAATGALVDSGAFVARVVRRTPASRANLRSGDVIIGLQNEPVRSVGELLDRIAELPPGAPITFQYVRAGITAATEPLALTKSGAGEARAVRDRKAGGEQALGLALGAPPPEAGGQGAEVVEVAEGSLAEKSGLKEGDLILEVNRQPVRSPEQLALLAQREPGTPLLLQIVRGQESLFLLVPPLA